MELLSGNEAIARGAWEAGARIGVAYPGTPSTETMESFARYEGVYAEWCPNEKVAIEVGVGASAAGKRVLSTMKHVGVNVAADPLYTAAYTGVNGGLVVLAADDPGMHSSQNEQDSRFHAMGARIPLLEPADSQEALEFTKCAFDLSEQFDVPFFIRSTVRISHTKCPVEIHPTSEVEPKAYKKDATKWVMMPAFARPRRKDLDERLARVMAYFEQSDLNRVIEGTSDVSIICAGATYQHVREALPDASILKLGSLFPLPEQTIRDFAATHQQVYVIEEASDYLSKQVKALGITLAEPPHALPLFGELTSVMIRNAFGLSTPEHRMPNTAVPNRPPALCPGCPHRMVFRELKRINALVTGDIGCYTLAALPPLDAMDTCLDMGASISMAHGFELGMKDQKHRPVVAVIGDSTFAHSGITSLLNTIYNQGTGTVCILDNRTTAMTGRQGNPVNGETLQGRKSRELNLPELVHAMGVDDVQVVDPQNMMDVRQALKHATSSEELSVIIFVSPCVLLKKEKREPYVIDTQACRTCGVCVLLGCPALSQEKDSRKAYIDPTICTGCGQCIQTCLFKCIHPQGGSHE